MAHIVILGAGLGGIPAALKMKEQARSGDQVTVISKIDKYTFIPSNTLVAVGWRKPEQVEVPLAKMFEKCGIDFIDIAAQKVLPEANQIQLINGLTIDFDYLIVAVGPDLAFDEVPGLNPLSGFTQSICQTDHAIRAHEAWQKFVQKPGPIVVGATQGASCFGPAYEFCMIMNTVLRRRKIRNKATITFVTSEPYIGHLGLGGVGDTKALLESVFLEHDIKWICNSRVEEVTKEILHVNELSQDGRVLNQHELPHAFSMLIPPFRGIRALKGIEGLVNSRDLVIVDGHQRNPKYPNIFAIGACLAIPPVEKTPVPVSIPITGFMIESMGEAAAHNIGALLNGEEANYKPILSAIYLSDFGDDGVGFVAVPQIPPRNYSWSSRGNHIHLGKRAFENYFLNKASRG